MLDRYQRQKKSSQKTSQLAPQPAPVDRAAGETPPRAFSAADDQPAFYSLVKIDCAQMLASGAEKIYPSSTIFRVQQQLIALGFNPDKLDGILGPNTKAAIGEYCKIDKMYPQWPKILGSGDFERWADKADDQKEIDEARLSGKSSVVIALLDRYTKQKTFTPGSWTDDFLVSYTLTKDDFQKLKSLKDILKLITKLQSETYANKDDFEAALDAALKGVAEPERYKQLVMKYAEPQIGIMLTDESFNSLRVENIPDYILQSIQSLKDLKYPDGEIDSAVESALNALADKTMGFAPEIVKLAKISPSGAKFTEDSLGKFEGAHKDDPLAVAVLGKLQNMKDVEYQSDKTMSAAVKNVLTQMVDQIKDSQPAIVESAEETSVYSLSEESMQEIDKQLQGFAVPEFYLEMLGDKQDAEYPDADLFWQAMKAGTSIVGSNNIIRKKIFGVIEMNVANKVDGPLLEKLKARGLPPAVLAQLDTLQGRKFDDTKALEDAVDALFNQLSEQFEPFRPVVVAQAKKMHSFDKSKNILWDGSSCNCVHKNLAGDVYGFYPYWMAGEKQVIDFSLLTRVGYYGLGFDDKGGIAHASRWSELNTGFIREAQTYGSKVDLVIYRNDWKTWSLSSAEEKAAAFENLAGQIVDLVDIPLSNLFSEAKPYISLGATRRPIMGDGVTLYFDGYPQDEESVAAFGKFIGALSDKLRTQKRKFSVNLMFRSSEMGKGIHDYHKLIGLMDTIKGNDGKLSSLFLVLLQEPTTNDKKLLRLNIENGLHGKDRMKLLRNVVMTLTFDGHNTDQLTDDVIYAKDNYGGIGFWPQAVVQGVGAAAAAKSGDMIATILHANYMNFEEADAPLVCKYVCPNKWAFRITWGIFFFAMLGGVAWRFISCTWRSFFDKHFIHFIVGVVVPAALLSMALLFCDPGWQEMSGGHSGLVLMFMAGIGYSIWNYQDKKRKANLP